MISLLRLNLTSGEIRSERSGDKIRGELRDQVINLLFLEADTWGFSSRWHRATIDNSHTYFLNPNIFRFHFDEASLLKIISSSSSSNQEECEIVCRPTNKWVRFVVIEPGSSGIPIGGGTGAQSLKRTGVFSKKSCVESN